MKKLLLILPLLALCGCAYLRSETIRTTDPHFGAVQDKTVVRVYTIFDSSSQLAKFRNTTGQVGNGSNVWSIPAGTTIGSLDSASTSTNLQNVVEALARGVVSGLK